MLEGRCSEGGNGTEVTAVCGKGNITLAVCTLCRHIGDVDVKRHLFLRLALEVSDQLHAPADLPQRTALATHLGQGRENRGDLEKKETSYFYGESNLRLS